MSKLSPLIRNGIVIAVVVVIVIAVRVLLPTDASSLQVGQCFDPPAAEGDVSGVDDGPCTDPHKAEVVFVGDYTPASDSYPISLGFNSFISSTCKPAFNSYTGLDFEADSTYALGWFTPTRDSWAKGNRTIICYAIRSDEAPMTKSIKTT